MYTKLAKTTVSAPWKSKERIPRTAKHVFVKNMALQWKTSRFCGILPVYFHPPKPCQHSSSNRAERLQKPHAFLPLQKWVHFIGDAARQRAIPVAPEEGDQKLSTPQVRTRFKTSNRQRG